MSEPLRRSVWGNDRQRVLEATDIVRLVERHVALKKKGREYVGKCPFHDDHKPSMFVVPAKQIYHCFSCGAGGNAIDFVVNFHKMEFIDALKHLAEAAGVALTPRQRADGAPTPDADAPGAPARKELIEACAFAHEFFVAILRHPEHGVAARAMLDQRAISADMVDTFGIGAAPDRWDGLLLTAQKRGIRTDALRLAGLLKERESDGAASSGFYDAFRNRLIFPIHDLLGRPIAFGGRKLREDDEPKYLNSPETPLFDKSRTLFGLSHAQKAIQAAGRAIIVEGYTDAIACHQAGVCNVVATLGTALTTEHARILQRLGDEVVLVFDGDAAGQRAADRAVEVFFAQPIDVRIASLGESGAKDPDELLQQDNGRDRFDAAIAGARDALEFRFDRLRSRLAGLGLSARAKLIEEDVARLVELGLHAVSPVRRQLIVRRLAAIAGTQETTIQQAVAAARRPKRAMPGSESGPEVGAPPADVSDLRPLRPAAHALGALLAEPSLWSTLSAGDRDELRRGAYAVGPTEGQVAFIAMGLLDAGREPDLNAIMTETEDENVRRVAAGLCACVERVVRPGSLKDVLMDAMRTLERLAAPDAVSIDPGDAIRRQRASRERFGRSFPVIPRPDPRVVPG